MRKIILLTLLSFTLTACNGIVPVRIRDNEPECFITSAASAVDWWNETLHMQFFQLVINTPEDLFLGCPLGSICLESVQQNVVEEEDWNHDGNVDNIVTPGNKSGHTSANLARRILKIDVDLENNRCIEDIAPWANEKLRIPDTATIIMHEMGHSLRLHHRLGESDPENLMNPKAYGRKLTDQQLRKAKRHAKHWFGKLLN